MKIRGKVMNILQKAYKYYLTLTITMEIFRAGKLCRFTLFLEQEYNDRVVPSWGCTLYRVMIAVPVVIVMRIFPSVIPLVARVAKFIWIDRVAKLQKKYRRGLKK